MAEPGDQIRLATALRRLRKTKGFSQRSLAPPLHLSAHSAIADYESGRRIPPADVIAEYERFFGVPRGDLAKLRAAAIADRVTRQENDEAAQPPGPPGPGVPRQLPVTAAALIGRATEMTRLGQLISPRGRQQVVTISGMAGVGKTELAVQWARRNESWFPDGNLFVNLRGYDPALPPVTPAAALDGMLRALGIASDRIPFDEADRAALFRTVTAGRSVLIVLDNARSAEQIRPLLPGIGAARAIVTSRSRLVGLAVREGAAALPLDVLAPPAAVELLLRVTGVALAQPVVGELAELCGRLPLALRVAAERIAADPAAGPLRLLDALSNPRARLDTLDVDDEATAVRRVLSWSYDALPAPGQRALRRLSHVGFADIDATAAAALIGLDLAPTGRVLDQLAAGHLLLASNGRYWLHDLVRCFARDSSAEQDSDADRRASVGRLSAWYLHSACNARAVLSPQLPPLRAGGPAPATAPAAFGSVPEALNWCETERANLVLVTRAAYDQQLDIVAWQLPTALYGFFELRKHWTDWIDTHTIALKAAARVGDGEAEGRIWCNLGNAYRPLYQFDKTVDCYRQALALFLRVGYRQGEAKVLGNLGTTLFEMGRLTESIEQHEAALALFIDLGDSYGWALTLTNLGGVYAVTGQFDRAMTAHQESLELFRSESDVDGQARAVSGMGKALAGARCHEEALRRHEEACRLFHSAGNSLDYAYVLADVMAAQFALGRADQAVRSGRQAAALLARLGHDAATGQVLADLTMVYELTGDPAGARACRQEAEAASARASPAQQDAARRLAAALLSPTDEAAQNPH